MSAVSSPAASPRASFHVHRPNYSPSAASTRQRSSHASPIQLPSAPATGARHTRTPHLETPASERPRQYVNQGTQYSPDGSPPTASATSHHKGKGRAQETSASAKKRKEPPEPMTSVSSASSASSGVPSRAPPEPDLRLIPSNEQPTASSSSSTTTHPSEPREARSTHGHSSAPKRSRPSPGSAILMPALYQNSNPKHLGVLISSMLMELIRLNDQIPLRDGRLTRFHSRAPPGISVTDYLQRLIHHATLSPPILLSMVWYIDLLCHEYANFTINSLTAHRFLITAATVAAKGLSDSFWTNPTYAKIGGIPVTELATLELEFLERVKWKIVPQPETLVEYYRSLVERTEGFELEGESGSGSEGSLGSSSGEEEKEGKDDGDERMSEAPT